MIKSFKIMKKVILTFCVTVLILFTISCDKEETSPQENPITVDFTIYRSSSSNEGTVIEISAQSNNSYLGTYEKVTMGSVNGQSFSHTFMSAENEIWLLNLRAYHDQNDDNDYDYAIATDCQIQDGDHIYWTIGDESFTVNNSSGNGIVYGNFSFHTGNTLNTTHTWVPIHVTIPGYGTRTISSINYDLPDANFYCGFDTDANFTDLPYGDYSYSVIDDHGHTDNGTFTLNNDCESRNIMFY